MKNMLVLTSGGDSSGMNSYLKSLTKLCRDNDIKLLASRYGFRGLIENDIIELDFDKMDFVENLGGSIIKSSRCLEFMQDDGFNKALKTLKELDVQCVVVVGGNGSFKGARDLKNAGVNVIAIPGTVDNDLAYSDLSLGFETACQSAVELINITRQTMETFDRGFIVEVMGRDCADIALYTSIITNADICITEDIQSDEISNCIKNIIKNGNESPLVVVKENLLDIDELANNLSKQTGKTFRAIKVGYAQRGGEPTNSDKMLAIELACATVKKFLNGEFGIAIGKNNDKIISKDISIVTTQRRLYSQRLYDLYNDYFSKKSC